MPRALLHVRCREACLYRRSAADMTASGDKAPKPDKKRKKKDKKAKKPKKPKKAKKEKGEKKRAKEEAPGALPEKNENKRTPSGSSVGRRLALCLCDNRRCAVATDASVNIAAARRALVPMTREEAERIHRVWDSDLGRSRVTVGSCSVIVSHVIVLM